jgi:hypothetical protein
MAISKGKLFWTDAEFAIQTLKANEGANTDILIALGNEPYWAHPYTENYLENYKDYINELIEKYPVKYWQSWRMEEESSMDANTLFGIIKESSMIIRDKVPYSIIISPSFPDYNNSYLIHNLFYLGMADHINILDINIGNSIQTDNPAEYDISIEKECQSLLKDMNNKDIPESIPLWATNLKPDNGDPLYLLHLISILVEMGWSGISVENLDSPNPGKWIAYREIIRALCGAKPAKIRNFYDTDNYNNAVIKLFNRGDEDIIILWNNSDSMKEVSISFNEPLNETFLKYMHQSVYVGEPDYFDERNPLKIIPPNSEGMNIPLKPSVFQIITIRSDKSDFKWMKNIK